MEKDIIVLAGSAPHSVLALCKMAHLHKARSFVVCVEDGFDYYQKSNLVNECYMVNKTELPCFWTTFFESHLFKYKPFLYATTDATCIIVDSNRSYYESKFELCVPSHYIIESFNDKAIAENEAIKYGLTVPKTFILNYEEDLLKIQDELKYPVIAKPQGAEFLHDVGFKYRIINNSDDLINIKNVLYKGYKIILQEYIPGGDENYWFYLFYRGFDGVIHECMGVKTLQYKGIMAVGTVLYNEHLSNICKSFITKIDYRGVGGLEFKYYNGFYYFIEMSTRTEGFFALADMSDSSILNACYFGCDGKSVNINKANDKVIYVDTLFWSLARIKNKKYFKWIKELVSFAINPQAHFAGLFLDIKFSLVRYWRLLFCQR